MTELRVVDPCDPAWVVRLKLAQNVLGVADLYHNGKWDLRTSWSPLAGFAFETVAGSLSEELALKLHALVSKRRRF